MISPEVFDKFLADIQEQIEERDKANKQKADDTLKAIAANYRQKLTERIAAELVQAEECKKKGEDMGAKHHEMLAEIYKSIFNIQSDTK